MRQIAYPILSFKDLELWSTLLHSRLSGMRVDRIFVPENPEHPDGFAKRTVVIELHSRAESLQLLVSLRTQECGLLVFPAKTHRPRASATQSGFEIGLAKSLSGSLLTRISAVHQDRIVKIDFQSDAQFQLQLNLIPGKPSGILRKDSILVHSTNQNETQREVQTETTLRTLDARMLEKIPFHPEWVASPDHYRTLWLSAEAAALFKLRLLRIQQRFASDTQSVRKKLHSLEEQLKQSETEENWAYYGTLLQTHLFQKPRLDQGHYSLLDYEKDEIVRIPGDPKLTLEQQLNRYFHLSKRNKKRIQESTERIAGLKGRLENFNRIQTAIDQAQSFADLQPIEHSMGIETGAKKKLPSKEQKKIADFSGKQFRSKEGLSILVGRNLAENLELIFKIARGNDLWLHVKGRPGSHTVILLPPNRTASLDTLLDAANLCILYSGGKDWGKTEVDYTPRKFVKKIKNQSEVSYSQNKTLAVQIDQERIKTLISSEII
jgi:predicted ribosome quality control (RQC) complex YloA/Tae2 family protein